MPPSHFSVSAGRFEVNMEKILIITVVFGLLAGAFFDSTEAVIRGGRDAVPYQPVEKEAEVMREMFERAKRPKYFKRGISIFYSKCGGYLMVIHEQEMYPTVFTLRKKMVECMENRGNAVWNRRIEEEKVFLPEKNFRAKLGGKY